MHADPVPAAWHVLHEPDGRHGRSADFWYTAARAAACPAYPAALYPHADFRRDGARGRACRLSRQAVYFPATLPCHRCTSFDYMGRRPLAPHAYEVIE